VLSQHEGTLIFVAEYLKHLMKTLFRITVMLLAAGSFQTCQDLAFESVESQVDYTTKAQAKFANAQQVFTISAIVTSENEPFNQFLVYIRGTRGSITVNWGDGTSNDYALSGAEFEVVKAYAASGRYQVSITGDVKNITHFQSSYGQGLFDEINLKPLTGLQSLRVSNVPGPVVMDVSGAKNLEDFTVTDITNLTEIQLPKKHALWAVSVSGDTNLTAATVDALINSVYQAAVKKRIWGFFHLLKYPYDEGGNAEMVGPPSATSIAQLTELQNVYGWEILPEMPRSAMSISNAIGLKLQASSHYCPGKKLIKK
jgi:hypothetical protein